jgi:hypothetical protein
MLRSTPILIYRLDPRSGKMIWFHPKADPIGTSSAAQLLGETTLETQFYYQTDLPRRTASRLDCVRPSSG